MTTKNHSDKLDAEERRELPDSDFGLPEEREYPMPDAAHVRAAEAYFRYAPENKRGELARNILKKAKKFGMDVRSQTILDWAEKEKSPRFLPERIRGGSGGRQMRCRFAPCNDAG